LIISLFLFSPFAFSQELDHPLVVGWIMESQGLGDGGFNDAVEKALLELQAEHGIEFVRTPRLDLYTDKLIYNLIELDVDVIIASDEGGMSGAMSEAARSNPDVKFILIGAEGAPLTNLASVLFEENEAGYMAGYIAGTVTEKNKVGFIGGGKFVPILRFEKGFMGGVMDTDSSVEVVTEYLSKGDDTSGLYNRNDAEEATRRLAGANADIVFCASGTGSVGAISGADKMDIWAIGLKNDRKKLAPDSVLSSVVYRFDVPVKKLVTDAVNGDFWGGIYVMGFMEGGLDVVGLSDKIGPDKARRIMNRAASLVRGDVDVPDYLDERRLKTIIVTHSINISPYEFVDEDGNSQGYVIDVMAEVGHRLGKEVVFKSFYGTRTESGLEENRSDIEPMIMLDEERVRSYITTDPWGISESVMVVPEDDLSPKDISELMAKTVGVSAGTIEESFLMKIPGIFRLGYSSTETALLALASGIVDAVIGDENVVIYHLSQAPLSKEDFMILEKPLIISPYAVAMAKPGDEAFLSEIYRALKSIDSDGTLDKLADKWLYEKGKTKGGPIKRLFN
jgi:basic membrane protein A